MSVSTLSRRRLLRGSIVLGVAAATSGLTLLNGRAAAAGAGTATPATAPECVADLLAVA